MLSSGGWGLPPGAEGVRGRRVASRQGPGVFSVGGCQREAAAQSRSPQKLPFVSATKDGLAVILKLCLCC